MVDGPAQSVTPGREVRFMSSFPSTTLFTAGRVANTHPRDLKETSWLHLIKGKHAGAGHNTVP